MFDEEPDGDPRGECAAEIARLQELLRWAYTKLHWWHVDDNKRGPFALRGPGPTHWMPFPAAPQSA